MAIINCPACKQRISDKAKTCSHCTFDLIKGENSTGDNQEKIESKLKLARLKKRYSLQIQAMSAIILFLIGLFAWYFIGQMQLTQTSHFIEISIGILGGFWYLITRVRLYTFKHSG